MKGAATASFSSFPDSGFNQKNVCEKLLIDSKIRRQFTQRGYYKFYFAAYMKMPKYKGNNMQSPWGMYAP